VDVLDGDELPKFLSQAFNFQHGLHPPRQIFGLSYRFASRFCDGSCQ
jgi:hypothetical protein